MDEDWGYPYCGEAPFFGTGSSCVSGQLLYWKTLGDESDKPATAINESTSLKGGSKVLLSDNHQSPISHWSTAHRHCLGLTNLEPIVQEKPIDYQTLRLMLLMSNCPTHFWVNLPIKRHFVHENVCKQL